ncbi:MAG: squalene--hopene cyclase, partial [Bryobacterales bacterium]|nr:squalene--hopene cyclase [Bryobacterales bacterium]
WDEAYSTGTGFPRVFYLCYTEYRNMFPLLALSTFRKTALSLREESQQSRYSCAGN